ncbi:hypothetical protein LC607_35745, partial [Nostoc sp. CHAB 5824]|nr:hypothetical protein [Nostoc sp. CHAB 5824]
MNKDEGTGENSGQGTVDSGQDNASIAPNPQSLIPNPLAEAVPILGEGTVVSTNPNDPMTQRPNEPLLEEEPNAELGSLSYRQLVWRKFRKSKLALLGMIVLFGFYFTALFAEFFAPYLYTRDDMRMRYVPPQKIRFFSPEGFSLRPFVYGLKQTRDPETLEFAYEPDPAKKYPVSLFHRGDSYKLFGLIPSNIHLIGSEGPFYLLGTDRMGRDLFSRIIYGGRVSLTVGLVGVFISILLGSFLGTLSGYWGGAMDMLMQRLIELLSAFPSIPLWMALAAAL